MTGPRRLRDSAAARAGCSSPPRGASRRTRASAARPRIARARLDAAGIPQRYRDCTLENFSDNTVSLTQGAHARAREFVDAYPAVEAGLLLVGPSGRGKTHLACAILSELVATKGVTGLYVDFSDLLMKIQTSFRPDADMSKESVLTPVRRGGAPRARRARRLQAAPLGARRALQPAQHALQPQEASRSRPPTSRTSPTRPRASARSSRTASATGCAAASTRCA